MVKCTNPTCGLEVDGVFICTICGRCVECCHGYAAYLKGDDSASCDTLTSKTCLDCHFNTNKLGLCYKHSPKQLQVTPTQPACQDFRQRCEKCDQYDALIQEYLEYRPFKPAYLQAWLQKLVNIHLEKGDT